MLSTQNIIGGRKDGPNYPADTETIELSAEVMEKETYIRETLSVGDVSITIYRHEALTHEQVLSRLMEFYKAWAAVTEFTGRANDSGDRHKGEILFRLLH